MATTALMVWYLVAFRPKIYNVSLVEILIFSYELVDTASILDSIDVVPVAKCLLKNWGWQYMVKLEKHWNVFVGLFGDEGLKMRMLNMSFKTLSSWYSKLGRFEFQEVMMLIKLQSLEEFSANELICLRFKFLDC